MLKIAPKLINFSKQTLAATARCAITSGHFSQYVVQQFTQTRVVQIAASLSFTSLLSLVPLMTVMVALMSAFPVFGPMGEQVQNFLFSNFIPSVGDSIQSYLTQFTSKAAQLTLFGLVFLMIVALMLIRTIDRAFNHIWAINKKRKLLNSFLVYWAIITLGPIFLGTSIAISSYVLSLKWFASDSFVQIQNLWFTKLPLLMAVLGFSALYGLVPLCKVKVTHALAGGLFAGCILEWFKGLFALYIQHFGTYQFIYGALSILPIFLLWLYCCWLIILFGALISRCLANFKSAEQQASTIKLIPALKVITYLHEAHQEGKAIGQGELLQHVPYLNEESLSRLLQKLIHADIITATENEDYILVRDLTHLPLSELLTTLHRI